MKSFKKLYILLALAFVSVALMSFIPSANTVNNSNNSQLTTPDPGDIHFHVDWKTVHVQYRTSGNYYVLYSDLVSGMHPEHTMTWGCGNLDLIPDTPDWDCSDIESTFSANGAEGCEYISVHSNLVPTPYNSIFHTINIQVKDDQGDESDAGGIHLYIDYTATPASGDPVSPCSSY